MGSEGKAIKQKRTRNTGRARGEAKRKDAHRRSTTKTEYTRRTRGRREEREM